MTYTLCARHSASRKVGFAAMAALVPGGLVPFVYGMSQNVFGIMMAGVAVLFGGVIAGTMSTPTLKMIAANHRTRTAEVAGADKAFRQSLPGKFRS